MTSRLGDYSSLSNPTALQSFLEAAPDAIVVVDTDGRIVIANRLAEDLFGYTRDELIGIPIERLVPERYQTRHVTYRAQYSAEPRTRPMGEGRELSGRRKDGSEFAVEISLSPLRTERSLLVISIIRDITERKVAENKLRASLKEKEVLLKEIHHRVKNSLQIVSSMLNLQMGQIVDKQALALFQESHARVRSIALFHEKLYQSKDLAHIDLAEYLKGLTNGLLASYGVNPDDVTLSIEAEAVPLEVDAAISCGLIVNELVSNSLKHAFPRGTKGHVEVRLRCEGPRVLLEVQDDGVGISPGIDLRSPSTLGLKLVCILAEQVHGTVHLDRQGGTHFIIRMERGDLP